MNPKVEDTGKYTIEIGGISSTGFLEVAEPDPIYTFTKHLKKKIEGYTKHETILECNVSSNMAIIGWYKGETKLEDGDRYSISKDLAGKCTLVIKNSLIEDTDDYHCKLEKQTENNITSTKVTITEYPYKFVKVLKSQQLLEKENITLLCELDDDGGDVKWFKGDQEITGDKLKVISKDGRKRKLVIKDAKITDAGMYSCVSNADKTEAEIVVNYLNRFNKKLKDTEAIERDKLILEIELQDKTAPADWTFNGKPIVPSERVEIKNLGGGRHQLLFNKLEMEDDGEIMCESGKLQSSMKLTVKKGESKPIIDFPSTFEAPAASVILMDVPYTSMSSKFSIFKIFN